MTKNDKKATQPTNKKITFYKLLCRNCDTVLINGLWHHSPFCEYPKEYRQKIIQRGEYNPKKIREDSRKRQKRSRLMEYELVDYTDRTKKYTAYIKKHTMSHKVLESLRRYVVSNIGVSGRGIYASDDYDGHTFVLLRSTKEGEVPVFIVNKKTLHKS